MPSTMEEQAISYGKLERVRKGEREKRGTNSRILDSEGCAII